MLPDFIAWHFVAMPRRLFEIWRGVLLFVIHFFAIEYHLRTFFKPWHRQMAHRGRGLDIGEWASVFTFNTIGRVIGMIFRTFVIFGGGLSLLLAAVLGPVMIVIWLAPPAIILFLIISGIINIIK